MPYINLQILPGATVAQKKRIVEDFTHSLVSVLGKSPKHIHIVIQEIAPENWGFAGQLTTEFLARRKPTVIESKPARRKAR